MKSIQEIQPFIDAVNDASVRARRVIFVIITASVVFFIPEWNTFDVGWQSSRMHLARKALQYQGWPAETRQKLENSGDRNELEMFDRSRQFYERRGFANTNELAAFVAKLENDHSFMVGIPSFNVSIQTNDLGIFCGFAFVVLLSMLRMSLARSLSNLKIAFSQVGEDAGESEVHKQVYNLLSMSQVLTVPPEEEPGQSNRLWTYLAKAFIFLPVLVQLIIGGHDIVTYEKGLILSRVATGWTVLGNVLFLGFVVTLTFACTRLAREYDKVFDDEFEKIKKSSQHLP